MENERSPRYHFLFPTTYKSELLTLLQIKNDLARPDHFPLSRDDKTTTCPVIYC